MSSDNILETRGLVKEFKGFVAVNDVNLKVRRGTIHALIGPNGAGKTTCFNLLTKFLTPTSGEILFNGIAITGEKPAEIARRGVIRSFQISAVFPHLTVLENVRIGLQRFTGTSFHFWKGLAGLRQLDARALELLELLNRSRVPMTLQALSQASGYPKSTIHSLLATLRSYGCIRQESDGRYYLGTKLFEWGCGVSAAWEITRCARPHLERLAQQTQYTALLSCVEGSDIVVIDQRVSGTGIQVASEIGGRTPLHATSQGKLLLSQLPDATVRYLMNTCGMAPFTPHTIVDLATLTEELERIRQWGYAIENGEYKIVEGLDIDALSQERINITLADLQGEQDGVKHLL